MQLTLRNLFGLSESPLSAFITEENFHHEGVVVELNDLTEEVRAELRLRKFAAVLRRPRFSPVFADFLPIFGEFRLRKGTWRGLDMVFACCGGLTVGTSMRPWAMRVPAWSW